MNKLRALQSSFLSDVMRDDATDSHYIQDSEKLPAAQRLQLYQEAYVLRLQEALTDSFPILEKYLGSEQFAVIAEQFIKSHPSRHFSIREFGDEFASFISATANSDEYLFLAELAAFEWALGRAFDGIDATPLQRSQLETVAIDAWPQLKFSFLPGFTKLKFSFNAPLIWKALSENQALPEIKQYEPAVYWVIWRPELDTLYRSVDAEENMAVACLQSSESFTAFCESLIEKQLEQADVKAAQYLNRWLEDRLLVAF